MSSHFENPQAVHRWTRDVDIFSKEFLFIPINYELHWSLAIVCNPGKNTRQGSVAHPPCILYMDSIGDGQV